MVSEMSRLLSLFNENDNIYVCVCVIRLCVHKEFNRLKFCRTIHKFQHYVECFYMLYQMPLCYNGYFLKTYRNTVK